MILTASVLDRTAGVLAEIHRHTTASDARQTAQLNATVDAAAVRILGRTRGIRPL